MIPDFSAIRKTFIKTDMIPKYAKKPAKNYELFLSAAAALCYNRQAKTKNTTLRGDMKHAPSERQQE